MKEEQVPLGIIEIVHADGYRTRKTGEWTNTDYEGWVKENEHGTITEIEVNGVKWKVGDEVLLMNEYHVEILEFIFNDTSVQEWTARLQWEHTNYKTYFVSELTKLTFPPDKESVELAEKKDKMVIDFVKWVIEYSSDTHIKRRCRNFLNNFKTNHNG